MYGSMRRGTLISALLHLFILLALIVTFPHNVPPEPQPDVDVTFIGPSNAPPQMNKNNDKGKTPAPEKTAVAHVAPPTETKPKPLPLVQPPPPPPPPPPSQSVPTPPVKTPPLPTPPPPPPTDVPTAQPMPKPIPPKPQKTVAHPTPPKPTPPTQEKADTTQPQSATHQRHDVKKPQQLSTSILNTLQNLKNQQQQTQVPTHVYNQDQGGDPDAGGTNQSTANSRLSGADKNAIGQHLRPCFNVDAGAPGLAAFQVLLDITTDAQGIIRVATIDQKDQSRLSDPLFNAYAQRAVAAAMNVQCATLPLPASMLGSNQNLTVEFVGQ